MNIHFGVLLRYQSSKLLKYSHIIGKVIQLPFKWYITSFFLIQETLLNKNIPVSEVSGGGGGGDARWAYPAHGL